MKLKRKVIEIVNHLWQIYVEFICENFDQMRFYDIESV